MGVEIQRIPQANGTIGDHWLPRSLRWFRCRNRGTSCITSWRSLFFMTTAHNQCVKNAVLQGTFNNNVVNGEFSAEPVPELRKALNLREDEIVVLTKACNGVIDAPRRWWKSLVHDTQQLGWRSCRHEPCLMTWHVFDELKGLMCFHVDDIMISGPKNDPEFKRVMDKVKSLFEWGDWNATNSINVGVEYVKQQTSPSLLIRRVTLERLTSLQCLHTDANT